MITWPKLLAIAVLAQAFDDALSVNPKIFKSRQQMKHLRRQQREKEDAIAFLSGADPWLDEWCRIAEVDPKVVTYAYQQVTETNRDAIAVLVASILYKRADPGEGAPGDGDREDGESPEGTTEFEAAEDSLLTAWSVTDVCD